MLDPVMVYLKQSGRGWVEMVRSIKALVLMGSDIGELIVAAKGTTCPRWATVPCGNDYLASTVSLLREIAEKRAPSHVFPNRLLPNMVWHKGFSLFEPCSGATRNGRQCCNRVQALYESPLSSCCTPVVQAGQRAGGAIFGRTPRYEMSLPKKWNLPFRKSRRGMLSRKEADHSGSLDDGPAVTSLFVDRCRDPPSPTYPESSAGEDSANSVDLEPVGADVYHQCDTSSRQLRQSDLPTVEVVSSLDDRQGSDLGSAQRSGSSTDLTRLSSQSGFGRLTQSSATSYASANESSYSTSEDDQDGFEAPKGAACSYSSLGDLGGSWRDSEMINNVSLLVTPSAVNADGIDRPILRHKRKGDSLFGDLVKKSARGTNETNMDTSGPT